MPPAVQFNLRFADPTQLLLIRELAGKSSDAEFLRERRELGASIARRRKDASKEETEAVAAERTLAKEQAEAEAAGTHFQHFAVYFWLVFRAFF